MMLLLLACVNLSGKWEGELDCDTTSGDYSVEVEFELSPDNGGYSGDGSLEFTFTSPDFVEVFETIDVEFEQPEQLGAQDLDYEIRGDECTVTIGGLSLTQPCDSYELTDADVEWDGANTLTLDPDNGDCDGEITRGN